MHGNGKVLANRFEILKEFKVTELSQTYLALDRTTQKKVIVKCGVCNAENERNSKIKVERLMVEAQILRCLNHPSVVKYVHSWGDRNDFYLATEYVEAKSMKETFAGVCPTREVIIEYILQLLEVTEYLHFKGVVHRDIKPSNILLGDIITLIDFDASESSSLTFEHKNVVIGTPGYQCPESFKGVISPHGDIYSIGGTLIFLLTGKIPSGELSHFKALSTQKDLLDLAFKAMNPDPDLRFRTVFEMKQKLLAISNRQSKLVFGQVQFPLNKKQIIIGRGDQADFKIIDPLKFVSPIHAQIDFVNNSFFISNQSINGTYVYRRDGYQKVDRWELLDGDIVALCYNPEKGPYIMLKFRRTT